MKILATNKFNEKLNKFTDDSVKNKLISIIEQIENSQNMDFLISNSQLSIDNFYVYKINEYRIFFTIDNDTLLFADIIKKESQKIRISSKNPKTNSSINPKFNSSINPKFNSSINPKFNSSINPKMNPSFNGLYLFDLDGNNEFFIVTANDKVI